MAYLRLRNRMQPVLRLPLYQLLLWPWLPLPYVCALLPACGVVPAVLFCVVLPDELLLPQLFGAILPVLPAASGEMASDRSETVSNPPIRKSNALHTLPS